MQNNQKMFLLQSSQVSVTTDYFYRAAWNADASRDENSVRPSVRLSVRHTHEL